MLSKRWFRVTAILCFLLAGILIGTPLLLKQYAKQWLLEHGGDEVVFEDINFNPFTATLVLKGLKVQVDSLTTLSFEQVAAGLSWTPLFDKKVAVERVELSGFTLVIDDRPEDSLLVGGIRIPENTPSDTEPEDTQPSEWMGGIEKLSLRDFHVKYADKHLDLALDIATLELDHLNQWSQEDPAHLTVSGSLNQAPFSLDAELSPLAAQPAYRGTLKTSDLPLGAFAQLAQSAVTSLAGKLAYDGKFVFSQKDGGFILNHDGDISLQGLDTSLNEPALHIRNKAANTSGTLDILSTDGRLQIRLASDIMLQDLHLIAEGNTLELPGLTYGGKLAFSQKDGGFILNHDGDIRLQGLDASLDDPALHIMNKVANTSGTLDILSTDDRPQIRLASDITLQDLHLIAEEGTLELLNADNLELSGISLEGADNLTIQSILAEQLGLGRSADQKSQDAFIDVGRFEVSSLALAGDLLTIDTVHYKDGHSRIKRNAEGQWRVIGIIDSMSRLSKQQQQAESAPVPDAKEDNPLAIAINRIEVSGDSKISFLDQAVKPEFKTELKIDSILVENLDTRKPEQHSDFKLAGHIGKHTRLDFNGYAQPFQQPFGIDLKSKIDALDLPPLSPYTRESLGLVLDSGALNADTTLRIDKKEMKGQIDLELQQLQLETVESENSLQSKIPVPLNIALDTLRDSNDTIALKIPIKGDPNSPSFDANDAITKALATGVKKGALTYLTFALQPYGAVITAAKYAGEELTRVHLKPVEFDPGLSEIDAEDKDYLGKVAKVLKERPKLAIKLCGVAVDADKAYLQKQAAAKSEKDNKSQTAKPAAANISEAQLTELAGTRANQVKDYLVEQFSIPASHLVNCQPRVDTDNSDSKPRTDLLI